MRTCLLCRRRWCLLVRIALAVVTVFNVFFFFGVPSFRSSSAVTEVHGGVVDGVQMSRKWSANDSSVHAANDQSPRRNFAADETRISEHETATDYIRNGLAGNASGGSLTTAYTQQDVGPKQETLDPAKSSQDANLERVGRERALPFLPVPQGQNTDQGHDEGADFHLPGINEFVKKFEVKYQSTQFAVVAEEKYAELLKRMLALRKKGPRLPMYVGRKGTSSYERFHYGIHQQFLYNPSDPLLAQLLNDFVKKKINKVEQKEGGTQIKLIITFEDGGQALFKPMRYGREQETLPDHFYFADFERHNAEIAAFHLDMVLGFNRVPPTVGRLMNVSKDIQTLSDKKLAKTFFVSPAGNLCFHGSCSYYCDSSHPICGHPMMLEGSLAAFLPPAQLGKRKTWRNPWKRSYSKHKKAYWEMYNDLCDKVKQKSPYDEDRRLLDVMDMSVFDFLTGNLDRHHYETFVDFGNDTFLLHLDNGRAFGKSKYDCMSCLAPIHQCCMIRLTTLTKLIKLYRGPDSLSDLMRQSMTADPLNPLLTESHLHALDRRVSKILHTINECIVNGKPWDSVVVNDKAR